MMGAGKNYPTNLKGDGAEQRLAKFFNSIMTAIAATPLAEKPHA